ncbi:MAG: hypothetical protein EP343_16460 [Deltaproteobacteria bacterium]|nr:MAG: hypothetical protein EP343_16460 [Deltaproteobacteria bacterium]
MSITWKEKERIIPLSEVLVEGTESGMVEDVKFRPNKYFHPVEDVRVEGARCIVLYQKDLSPVEGKVPLEQIKYVIRGVLDGQLKMAQDQVFYLYPGVEAFGLDRRRQLRIGLINARPQKDWERPEQEMNVDAFTHLIAEHCPEGHKRVVAYKQKILTLRHLLQVLEGTYSSSMWSSLMILLLILGGITGLLYQWGPPRVRGAIRSSVSGTVAWGRKMLRTSTQQWDLSLREERRRLQYRHDPMPVRLVIVPQSKDPSERQLVHQKLSQLLKVELNDEPKARYQLFVPQPSQFPAAYSRLILPPSRFPELMAQWKTSCSMMYGKDCPAESWLLVVENYRGGFRPLLDAVKEAMKRSKDGGLKLKYQTMVSAVTIGWEAAPHPPKESSQGKKAAPRTRPQPAKRPDKPAPTPRGK